MQRNSKENRRPQPATATRNHKKATAGQHSKQWQNTLPLIAGGILVALGIFLFFSYVSYFFTGAKNQGLVLSQSLSETVGTTQEVAGHTGSSGAFLMHMLVNNFLGIPLLFLIYYITIAGAGLLRLVKISYIKQFIFCVVAAFWSALFLAMVCKPFEGSLFFYPGGMVGMLMYTNLVRIVGMLGVILILALALCIILLVSFQGLTNKYLNWTAQRQLKAEQQKQEKSISPSPENTTTVPEVSPTPTPPTTEDETHNTPNRSWKNMWGKATQKKEEEEEADTPTNTNTQTDLPPAPLDAPPYEAEEEYPQPEELSIPPAPEPFTPMDKDDQEVHMEIIDTTETNDQLTSEEISQQLVQQYGPYDPRRDLGHYTMPPLDLLEERATVQTIDADEIQRNKEQIIATLRSFKLEISSITATVGPTITLYEVVPQTGVKISQIRNLEDDIALSLAALGIRIIAPIPGKGTVGIEVPNKKPQMVSMRSVISSRKFQESKMELPIALGRTITNEVFTFDLAKVPHLLVAGATGQGKSVGLNAIISSLLYKKHPSELKFVMVDPKMVEFSIYASIERHYLAKIPTEKECIITDTNKVIATLNSLCQEMDDRYELLMKAKVRNVMEYNEKFKQRLLNPEHGHRYMPYIVVIIDEYGDLIMTAGKDIELPLARLAQKARAVGMHAIIATQRPTASIITGTIKANFPGRMSFRVFSMVDSRTILDAPGANRLVGKGDLLFSQGNEFIRIQCAFVDTPEVTRLVDYIATQQAYPQAYELPEVALGDANGATTITAEERDPLFEQAARMFVMEKQASTSLLQRKYSIGYNRAGRLMDQLEAAGVVGRQDGSKPREVLLTDTQLEQFLTSL